ncbi:hypothetical protein D3C84_320990 [compost metagenome]
MLALGFTLSSKAENGQSFRVIGGTLKIIGNYGWLIIGHFLYSSASMPIALNA